MGKNILIETIVKNISRKIINEAVSDKVVKQIHRFLVKKFRDGDNAVEDFTLIRSGEEVVITVYFALEEIEDFNHPFSIDAGSEQLNMKWNTYYKLFLKISMSLLNTQKII